MLLSIRVKAHTLLFTHLLEKDRETQNFVCENEIEKALAL